MPTMKLAEIISHLEQLAPPVLQESYDNAGLLIGDKNADITGALVCLDVTEAVLDEAIARNLNLIIAHHPLIFKPLKRIVETNPLEKMVVKAIRHHIAVYAIHTNLDSVMNGVSASLANRLGLVNTRVLSPRKGLLRKLVTFCPKSYAETLRQSLFAAGAGKIGNYDSCSFNTEGTGTFRALDRANPFVGNMNELHYEAEEKIELIYPVFREQAVIQAMKSVHPYEEVAYDVYVLENELKEVGYGIVGELPEQQDSLSFLNFLKEKTGTTCLRHTSITSSTVKKIAVCGGSGSFMIREAMAAAADVFVTGDVKYHEFLDAEGHLLIADIGHYESERFVLEFLHADLNEKFPNFANFISEVNTNPIHCLS